ncbi:MAG: methyltransferase domain-containing protein [Ancalomicrobiaceae bacterium]|nr:methyltransferase domain-containing protein [Ancalomicrobiaceae bacterium]
MSSPAFRSSGDLAADRRYSYAMALLADGDAAAAGDLLDTTLELVPDWVPGWLALGEAREAAGDRDRAVAAFARALELEPQDTLGASLRLARLGAMAPPAAAPAAFVRDLFDDYAPRFDKSLVDGLHYCGPELIAAALQSAVPGRRFARAVDLGCGTGLMAAEIRASVGHLTGVDLSSGMIAAARGKGAYDRLVVGDIGTMLAGEAEASLDLVTAADVFCYLGDLAPIIAASRRVLAPGGLFAFTIEDQIDAAVTSGFSLRGSLRYCHRQDYVIGLGRRSGLDVLAISRGILRTDRGLPVEGFAILFGRA